MAHAKSDQKKSKKKRRAKHLVTPVLDSKAPPDASEGVSDSDLAGLTTGTTSGPTTVQEIQIDLLRVFAGLEHCRQQLGEGFGGQPFLPDLAPHCPANMTRFQLYLEERCALTRLFCHAVDLWIMCCRIAS
jgi:hypothetical protein